MEYERDLLDLRQRVLAGDDIPPEEYKRIIDAIREDRRAGAESAKTRAAKTSGKAKVTPLSDSEIDDLFSTPAQGEAHVAEE